MTDTCVLLTDNGSKRPGSTLQLRALARRLGERIGVIVHPVSLLHSDRIDPSELDGQPADTLTPFIRRQIRAGRQAFLVLPLFFGESRAITDYIPEQASVLQAECGEFRIDVADVLFPLTTGEPRLAQILRDNVVSAADIEGGDVRNVVLVDHGSPLPRVTRVREALAERLSALLGPSIQLHQAVMERRAGAEYDFNGTLLEDRLSTLALDKPEQTVVLSMLFIGPGRHAGEGGDIAQFCRRAEAKHPGLRCSISPLVGAHPGLIDILIDRYTEATRRLGD